MAYIGSSPVIGEFKKLDDISSQFNNSNVNFTLTAGGESIVAGTPQSVLISVDGILQEPTAAYTLNGSTITFTEAPNTSSTFFGIQLGGVGQVGIPSDSSITTAKIADSNVTTAKIADDSITSIKISPNIIFRGTTTYLGASVEKANVIVSNVTANVTIDNQNNGIVYYTNNSTSNADITVDFINMDSITTGNVTSFVLIFTNNTDFKAYVGNVQINGQTGNVVRYLGGVPTEGDVNINVYSFSVVKTAASSYTTLASKNNFD